MHNLRSLLDFTLDHNHKCEICIESKFARYKIKSILMRSNELLGLIYIDHTDVRSTTSDRWKKLSNFLH